MDPQDRINTKKINRRFGQEINALTQTETGRKRLETLNDYTIRLWNNETLRREDLFIIAYILMYKALYE